MSEAPRYTIRTLQDMAQVPPDRIDAFLVDLRSCLLTAHGISDISGALCEGIDPNLSCPCVPEVITWVDDGAHDLLALHVEGKENFLPCTIKHEQIEGMVEGMHQVAQLLREAN